MRMYVANGSHQVIDFQYRLPEIKNYRQQIIPIGGQIQISGDLSTKEIEAIVEHHTIYGMRHYSEISKNKDIFIPCIYSIGDVITAETITELIVQNREFNEEVGREHRKLAAITVNSMIEDSTSGVLKNLEMTIEEKSAKDRDVSFVPEGVRVTRDRDKGAPQEPINFASRKQRSMF
jgi:hypothetical protein